MTLSAFQTSELRVEETAGICVATVTVPQLTDEINLERLGHTLFGLVEQQGCRALVVSLKGVVYLTSSAIGKLITLHRRMRRLDGQVLFCDLEPSVRDILDASRLISYFDTVDSVAAALARLSEGPPPDASSRLAPV